MTEPSTLVLKAIGRLNATWNSVKQRALAWSLSQSHGGLHNVNYARMTACDSIEHAKKCLFGKFHGDVHGGSVGRASVFHAKVAGSNLTLVTFFSFSFLILVIA